jgi:hypothetical protein
MRLVLFLVLLFSGSVFSQSLKESYGSRAAGMGTAAVMLTDVWSVFNNQAALTDLKSVTAGISVSNKFLLKELSVKSVGLAIPIKLGTLGAKVSSFGYNVYQESFYGLAYGIKLSNKFSMGVGLNYESVNINAEGYSRKSGVTGEVSLLAKISDKVQVASHIYNPTRTQLFEYNDERIPTIFNLGASYLFDQKARFVCEVEKDIDFKPIFKGGVEYLPTENIYLRFGASNQPALYSFGFGFKAKQLNIDIASSYHNVLGFSPQVSIIYSGKEK